MHLGISFMHVSCMYIDNEIKSQETSGILMKWYRSCLKLQKNPQDRMIRL